MCEVPRPASSEELNSDVVARARDGDERAVAQVWRALQPELLRYLRSLGHDDAQDTASIIWSELARALPGLVDNEPSSLRKLLFTIARRRRIDEFRRRARTREIPSAEPFDAEAPPEAQLDDAIEMLRNLPPAQAEVVALRVIVGLSSQEVGELTGQTPAAVRVMAHRGLSTLRDMLSGEGTDSADKYLEGGKRNSQDDVTNGASDSKSPVK